MSGMGVELADATQGTMTYESNVEITYQPLPIPYPFFISKLPPEYAHFGWGAYPTTLAGSIVAPCPILVRGIMVTVGCPYPMITLPSPQIWN